MRFSTETGGGIAFVSKSEDREAAIRLVIEHVHYDWRVVGAEVIGTSTNVQVSQLYHVAGIYHFGGDSNI
ncbi:MAG: hypothetical protein ABFC57_13880 [Veillonellales bacterium]